MKQNITGSKDGNMGKITVKHFINKSLNKTASSAIIKVNGKEIEYPPSYPLYIKITFMRMTTQIKSIVYGNFATTEDAFNKHSSLMKMESHLITDIITSEYRRAGDKFKLKGIAEKVKPYNNELYDFFPEKCFVNEYEKVILKSRSIYMRVLLSGFYKISPGNYFEAAMKLLDSPKELAELNTKLEIVKKFRKVIKRSARHEILLIDWVYGKGKEEFTQKALSAGMSFSEIVTLVAEIDKQIETIK